jgi:hypothetical protein
MKVLPVYPIFGKTPGQRLLLGTNLDDTPLATGTFTAAPTKIAALLI